MNPDNISFSDKVIEFRVFPFHQRENLVQKVCAKVQVTKGVSMFVSRYKGGIALFEQANP